MKHRDALIALSAIAIAAAPSARAQKTGMLVAADPFFEIRREQMISLAERYRTPTFYFVREFVSAGAWQATEPASTTRFHAAGVYTRRILRGAKPANLPVLQPSRFELVINVKTAKALGLTIPQSLLLRADEVIE